MQPLVPIAPQCQRVRDGANELGIASGLAVSVLGHLKKDQLNAAEDLHRH